MVVMAAAVAVSVAAAAVVSVVVEAVAFAAADFTVEDLGAAARRFMAAGSGAVRFTAVAFAQQRRNIAFK
jgi:hypothetical protein